MKNKWLILLGCTAFLTFACSESQESETEKEETEEVENSAAQDKTLNNPPADIDIHKNVELKETPVPKLGITIGLAPGYSVNLMAEFDDMISYEVKKGEEVIFYLHSKGVQAEINEGKFVEDPNILAESYDAETTVFVLKEARKVKSGNKITGLVYHYSEDEDAMKRYEYYVETEANNFIYACQEVLGSNIDEQLAMIYSIRKAK